VKIVRIVSVVDTREYEEVSDGKFKPIPGSGSTATCSRCGRGHEVHATVELSDGTTTVVGTGCANKMDMSIEVEMRAAASKASAGRRLQAELTATQTKLEQWRALRAAILARPLPEIVAIEYLGHPGLKMADAKVSCQFARTTEDYHERQNAVISQWRDRRFLEHGSSASRGHILETTLDEIERRLTRLGDL
jgi:hypothetical protein